MGLWLNPGLATFSGRSHYTFVNLSTQTINACQSRHVSSCDRAVGSEQKPPHFLFLYMNIFRHHLEIVHPYQIQRTAMPHMRLGTVSEISGEIRITRYAMERKMDFSMFSYVYLVV